MSIIIFSTRLFLAIFVGTRVSLTIVSLTFVGLSVVGLSVVGHARITSVGLRRISRTLGWVWIYLIRLLLAVCSIRGFFINWILSCLVTRRLRISIIRLLSSRLTGCLIR